MRTRAGIVLQARMASTRLPGKALALLAGRPLLEHCLRRLVAGGVAHVVLATTDRPEDAPLVAMARRLGLGVYCGDGDDVLGRYVAAAAAFDLDPVVRATGDNPGVDPLAAGRTLAVLRETGADYACEAGLPVGAAVEGIRSDALRRAAALASTAYDREHVTTFVKSHPDLFRLVVTDAPVPLRRPDLRLTVDTPADLAWVRELWGRTGREHPALADLIDVAGRHPAREVA